MIAIYARQSVDKKDSISIESQIDKCKAMLEDNETNQYKIYQDKGFSGKNTDRPMFIQMTNDIKLGLINKVIVYKVDRISRAIVDFGSMMVQFKKYHVEFISFSEKFDTTTPIGMAMLNIIMVFAQLERETIQQRVKDNYFERGKQGYYTGGQAPYGYIKISTILNGKKTYTYKQDKEKSSIVKWIYKTYIDTNCSLNSIAKQLNERNIKTNTNHIWSSMGVRRILKNPAYVKANADIYMYYHNLNVTINNDITDYVGTNGCYLYREKISDTDRFSDLSTSYLTLGLHEGFISSEIWLKAQDRMKDNKQIKNSKHGTHSWLSGIMKCGYCGFAITVVPNNRGHNYINCCGRKNHVCNGRRKVIHLEEIENEVEKKLIQHMKNYSENLKLQNVEEQTDIDNVKINQLKIQIAQIDQKIENLINTIADGNSSSIPYINKAIAKLDVERKSIVQQIGLNKKNIQQKEQKHLINIEDSINNWDNLNILERKKIAQSFIKTVTITDDEIKIDYL